MSFFLKKLVECMRANTSRRTRPLLSTKPGIDKKFQFQFLIFFVLKTNSQILKKRLF